MNIVPTALEGVLILEPRVFGDPRGYFMETYQRRRYLEAGIRDEFVQDNLSYSCRHTIRGLHFQHPCGQDKLVQVVEGEIFDVAVDVRYGSPTFGRSVAVALSAADHRQLFIPRGFAHGFCVLSPTALFMYKCSDYYAPEHEVGIAWDDPDLGIAWPTVDPLLSDKDRRYPRLRDVATELLPRYEG
jgi:dTDP-4-dehydrorhamnose 3,5-epimerase